MAKLSIKEFNKGKTSSPYTTDGMFWKSANLDIHGLDGLARINYKPTGVTGTSPNHMQGLLTSFAPLFGTGGNVVFADNNKPVKCWTGGTTITNVGATTQNAYYVATWKGYVLATTFTGISCSAISAGMDGAWTSITGALTSTTGHKILTSSRDGKVYIANDKYVVRLEEVSGQTFDPTNAGTFTLTTDAFALPTGYQVESLEDFGRFVALFVVIKGQNRTFIMLWDRMSTEDTDAIFEIKEVKMTSTLEYHGTIFITGGHQGNIYVFTESGLRKYAQIKIDDLDNDQQVYSGGKTSYQTTQFNSMAWWKDRLMVAVNTSSGVTPSGIYSVKDGKVNHEFIASNGTSDNTNVYGSMISWDAGVSGENALLYGYFKSSDYYLDVVRDTFNRLESGCYFETPMLRAGYKMRKNNLDRVEALLARPLQTGESIKLSYRRNISDSWETLGTKSHTTDKAQSTLVFPAIRNIENLQLKVEMGTGATSKNTPYLLEIALF